MQGGQILCETSKQKRGVPVAERTTRRSGDGPRVGLPAFGIQRGGVIFWASARLGLQS